MGFIKSYKLFTEGSSIEDEAYRKQLDDIKKDLTEFKSKKSSIDSIYSGNNDRSTIESKIEGIIGRDVNNRNPYIVEYVSISKLKMKLETNKDNITKYKLDLADLKSELTTITDINIKNNVNTKISEINTKISNTEATVKEIIKEIADKSKLFEEKMKNVEVDIKNKIDKLSKNI